MIQQYLSALVMAFQHFVWTRTRRYAPLQQTKQATAELQRGAAVVPYLTLMATIVGEADGNDGVIQGATGKGGQTIENDKDTTPGGNSSAVNLAFLSIRIPSVTLIADDFAAYKIVIADKKQKWVVFRRYSSILKFHNDLARFAPEALAILRFPKKKWFGNRQPNYLEKRRAQLELYFRMLLNTNLPRSQALKERIFSFFSKSDPEIENNVIFRSIRRDD